MTRKALLARITRHGNALRTLGSKTVEVTWLMAQDLVLLQGTFPQGSDGASAFVAAASTASGKGEATVRNLVRAVEVRDSLTPKQREGIEGWSYDMVLSLADKNLKPAQRTSIIEKVQKAGTRSPIEVRKIKRTVAGGSKRTRKSNAEQTTALAEKIRKDVEKLLGKGHDPVSLAAGAQLAREYQGDVASAITFIAVNAAAAKKIAA